MSLWGSLGSLAGSVLGNTVLPGIGGAIGGALGGVAGNAIGGGGGGVGGIKSEFGSPAVSGNKNPMWVQNAAQDLYNNAKQVASRPYQAYTGEMVAPATSNQKLASTNAYNQIGQYNPLFSQAQNLYAGSATPYSKTYTPTDVTANTVNAPGTLAVANNPQNITTQDFTTANITGYMNPYIQASLNPQIRDINEQYDIMQNKLNQQAAGGGNFGGSRNALQQNLLDKQRAQQIENVTAQGYNTAYGNAQNAYETDQSRNLQGQQAQAGINAQDIANRLQAGEFGNTQNMQAQLANQNTGLNAQQFNAQQGANAFNTNYNVYQNNLLNLQRAAAGLQGLAGTEAGINQGITGQLASTGGTIRDINQAQDAAKYQEYLNQFNYPLNTTQYLSNMLKANPESGAISPSLVTKGNSGVGNMLDPVLGAFKNAYPNLFGGSSSSPVDYSALQNDFFGTYDGGAPASPGQIDFNALNIGF